VFATTLMIVFGGTAASADGPSGSTESGNNVTCANGTEAGGVLVYAGTNGAEWCNDGRSGPVSDALTQGRIIVALNGADSYLATDGDVDNPSITTGSIRVQLNPAAACFGDRDATQPC
jgi:hypothetical protein